MLTWMSHWTVISTYFGQSCLSLHPAVFDNSLLVVTEFREMSPLIHAVLSVNKEGRSRDLSQSDLAFVDKPKSQHQLGFYLSLFIFFFFLSLFFFESELSFIHQGVWKLHSSVSRLTIQAGAKCHSSSLVSHVTCFAYMGNTSVSFVDANFLYAGLAITSQTKILNIQQNPIFFRKSSVYKLGTWCIPHDIYMKTSVSVVPVIYPFRIFLEWNKH
jgi:hypothetical protein